MPAEWYYLDNGTQFGPVSGRELKQLADARKVFPWTPVKRVSGGDASPWTRAGAVQGMFVGNVIDKLGDPICDDCGHVLENGKCQNCLDCSAVLTPPIEPPPFVVAPVSEPQEPSQAFQAPKPVISIERRYPNLRAHVGAIKLLAVVQLLIWGLIAVVAVIQGMAGSEQNGSMGLIVGILVAAVALLIGLMVYTALMAIAELFLVFIDTEENTRRTSAIIQRYGR